MLWITVDRSLEKPLIKQVYDQIRMHILRGELQAGERLPSTRELAADLHVSRIVILEAYDQLLTRFIEEGHLERHIMNMRKIYRKRRIGVINALKTHFPNQVRILGDATGLHLVAEFGEVQFREPVMAVLEKAGVRIYPVEFHAIGKGYHRNKVIMGYGNLTNEEIDEGVRRIKSVLGYIQERKQSSARFCSAM